MLDGSRERFQTRLIFLFAGMAIIGILPFALYRYSQGDYLKAIIDLLIVVAAATNALFVWRSGQIVRSSFWAALLYSGGTLAVVYLNSPLYFFWLFPAIIANLFLLQAVPALVVNLLMLAATVPLATRMDDNIAGTGMVVATVFAICMIYVFSRLTESQQAMLERYASEDALTGLGNRRMLDIEMERCIQDMRLCKLPASVIVLDIDNFKSINDRFGHQRGDALLVELARLLVAGIRKTDRVFRFGGEEFVIIAPNTRLEGATRIAEDVRQQVALHLSEADETVTASFGCAELRPGDSLNDWFDRADTAMYSAKRQGKNRVAVSG